MKSKLPENIKKLRMRDGLTQEEVATYLGKSKNVVTNWEKGTNRPDVNVISQLCVLFNVTPNEIMGWESETSLENIENSLCSSLSAEACHIGTLYDMAIEDDKIAVDHILKKYDKRQNKDLNDQKSDEKAI